MLSECDTVIEEALCILDISGKASYIILLPVCDRTSDIMKDYSLLINISYILVYL